MSKPVVLVTGANGEIGRSLLQKLHSDGRYRVVTVDLTPLDAGQYLRIKDMSLPGTTFLENPEAPLAFIEMPKAKKEEEAAPAKKAAAPAKK